MRNDQGDMMPIVAFACATTSGPVLVIRYNMYPRRRSRQPAPGTSSGQAIELMEKIADKELPPSMRIEWTELALLQLQTGNTAM